MEQLLGQAGDLSRSQPVEYCVVCGDKASGIQTLWQLASKRQNLKRTLNTNITIIILLYVCNGGMYSVNSYILDYSNYRNYLTVLLKAVAMILRHHFFTVTSRNWYVQIYWTVGE